MKILSIVGARPQFIKVAAVSRAIRRFQESPRPVEEVVIHTGQHYDDNMSKVFFDELGIRQPDYHLGVASSSHGKQTGEMLERIEEVLLSENPDYVIVYGDTNSTLAGALAAVKSNMPVAHIEAGLRSYNRTMPEEINRIATDHISNLLFCPTDQAVKNLKAEGITEQVHNTGDVMYDAAIYYAEKAEKKSEILDSLNLSLKSYYLATVHRAGNTDDINKLKQITAALDELDMPVIFPVHPRTRKALKPLGLNFSNLRMIDPVSYLDMINLERNAELILTDSGGVQKEAFFFKVPCVTLREETEWVETLEGGHNRLAGSDKNKIKRAASEAIAQHYVEHAAHYGVGAAAANIIDIIFKALGK